MTTYINIKEQGQVETIDEFETRKEAKEMIKEYRLVYNYGVLPYLSSRCTKEWRER